MIIFTVSNTSVYSDGARAEGQERLEFESKDSFSSWLANSCPYTLTDSNIKDMLNGRTMRFRSSTDAVSHTSIFSIENTDIGFWEKILNKIRGKKNGT